MDAEPPADAEAWSSEEWIAWLEATDPPEERELPAARRVRADASTGARLFGAAMLGMYEAIYGPSEDPDVVLVEDADGQGAPPDGLELRLVPGHPELSSVVLPSARRRPESDARTSDRPSQG